jgi:hypothetical protein
LDELENDPILDEINNFIADVNDDSGLDIPKL